MWRAPVPRRLTAAAGCLLAAGPAAVAQPAPAPVVQLAPPGAATDALLAAAPAEPATPPPPPFGGPLLARPKLTGDWGGVRDTLRDRGLTWDVSAANFYQGVTSGGLERTFRYGGRADYLLNVNGEKAGLVKGMLIDLHAETLFGESVNGRTGALLPVSIGQSVPVPDRSVTALTGVKVTQFLSESFGLFAGKINTADGFNQPFTGGPLGVNGFQNTGLVLPPVLARTIPYSTFGAGAVVLAGTEPVLAVSVFDTHNTPTVSGFDTFLDNGVTITGQVNLPIKPAGLPGHQSVGVAYSTGRYATLDENLPYLLARRLRDELPPLPRETGSWVAYYLFDQALHVDPADARRSWGAFGSAGISDGNPNPIKWSAGIGMGGASPFRGRPLDTFGAGYFYVGLSEDLKRFATRLLPLGDEHGVEVFYNVGLTPWFHLTPDLQVVTPARVRVDTSVNFGIRAKLDF